jgi:hypothetical protein
LAAAQLKRYINEFEIMKLRATDNEISNSSLTPNRLVRKSLIIYLPLVVIVPIICFILGRRSLDNIGSGFIYGSVGLVLFGALTFAANTVPAQLSRLSLPKYKRPSFKRLQEGEGGDSQTIAEGKIFLFATVICGVLLLVTGFFLKILQ